MFNDSNQQGSGLATPETDELAAKWEKKIAAAKKHWDKVFEQMRKNRKEVRDLEFGRDGGPTTKRANLMLSTMTATIPNVYAKNPEISVTAKYVNKDLKLFCQTLETVTNRALVDAGLKKRAKSLLTAAMTCYHGVIKVTYQRDINTDPYIRDRINDTQDNIVRLEHLIQEADNPERAQEHEATLAELRETMKALEQQTEVVAAEGLAIDKVPSDQLLIDPDVCEFDEYPNARWMAQIIPMRRSDAQAKYKVDLSKALVYKEGAYDGPHDRRIASMPGKDTGDDPMIVIFEIWDRQSQRIYTMADGCKFWCRDPYSPDTVGERWYPYFLFPFATVDNDFIAPCFVDLTRKLELEYNETRDKFKEHRELNKPGLVVDGGEISEKNITKVTESDLGEVVVLKTDSAKPLNQIIQPRPSVPINPVDYDTSSIRADWEQVTGLQDAARSTVVTPKTATEASIMQQSLSGRVSEMRDRMEDFLQEVAQYSAQILLMNLTPEQVARYMGPGKATVDKMTGMPVYEPSFDWPQLSREQVFDMVQLEIRAGTTGAPDKLRLQENWAQALPIIMNLISQIMQLAAQGIDYSPLRAILEETLRRFDERVDVEEFLPVMPQSQPAAQPAAAEQAMAMQGVSPAQPEQPPIQEDQSGLPPPPPAMANLLTQGA
ncbi:hypothetical protein [Pusillimonas minor]|uniref:Portal protein n=1 Tax=Pusillimonas minor TaxID=2697024 RepID=A0A842HIU4_9BURK|nr:hypothetical protein [Pusillimonas minor]MBC2768569.1 hypothetical protein [Pusillimonas minor]